MSPRKTSIRARESVREDQRKNMIYIRPSVSPLLSLRHVKVANGEKITYIPNDITSTPPGSVAVLQKGRDKYDHRKPAAMQFQTRDADRGLTGRTA